jgi:hypothetical protein
MCVSAYQQRPPGRLGCGVGGRAAGATAARTTMENGLHLARAFVFAMESPHVWRRVTVREERPVDLLDVCGFQWRVTGPCPSPESRGGMLTLGA